jgi:hypothetical protein
MSNQQNKPPQLVGATPQQQLVIDQIWNRLNKLEHDLKLANDKIGKLVTPARVRDIILEEKNK